MVTYINYALNYRADEENYLYGTDIGNDKFVINFSLL